MGVRSFKIRSLDRDEVLRYLGYHGQAITPELDGLIDEAMARALEVGSPHGVWRSFEVESARQDGRDHVPELRLRNCSLVLQGFDIAEHLRGAKAVGVMAVTAGMGIDQELRKLALSDPMRQIVFDSAGTALVERAADAAEACLLAEAADQGLYVNWRFSPGYGDLPLACQPTLLASVDAMRQLGLTLTASGLMVPTKSVTAVIGMFDEPQASRKVDCQLCHCKDFCTIRSGGRTCHG
jgi:hypothetical protein